MIFAAFGGVLMILKAVYGVENLFFLNESIFRSVSWIFLLRHNRLISKSLQETAFGFFMHYLDIKKGWNKSK